MDEYQIVELVKHRYRTTSLRIYDYFLSNDATIISKKLYKQLYQHNPFISNQVIGYVNNDTTNLIYELELPMLTNWKFTLYAYLHKKGYVIREYSPLGPGPLPNLKYVIYCITTSMTEHTGIVQYEFQDRLVIELVDLDVVGNNLNLPEIMSLVLGPKLVSGNEMSENEFYEIADRMRRQKLFGGHTWNDADYIVRRYFDGNERERSKEVFKISQAYERVFRPYRVVYDTKTWEPVVI